MENQNPIAPYNDPTGDDPLSAEQILDFGNESGPFLGFSEFPEIVGPSKYTNYYNNNNNGNNSNAVLFSQTTTKDPAGASPSYSAGCGGESFFSPSDPMSDLWDLMNDSSGNEDEYFDFKTASSGDFGCGGYGNNYEIPQIGNPIQLSIWPVPPTPYNCSGCHILREIIHTNGEQIANLEIHGRLGIISHAIFDKHDYDFSTQNHEYQMYDFCKESIVTVQNFLLQYCEVRKLEGYSLVPDPLSIFYKTLCIGIDDMDNQNNNVLKQPTPMANSENDTMPAQQQDIGSRPNAEGDCGNGVRPPPPERGESSRRGGRGGGGRSKTSLAAQRERTGKMKLQDFSGCFDLPISAAAERMNVCSTVIKKKCREAGLERWPYRKIRGLKRKINDRKQKSLSRYVTDEERARLLVEIKMLEQELAIQYQEHHVQGDPSTRRCPNHG